MKKEVQARFEKGEAKVVAVYAEGAFITTNIVEIEHGIDDRVIGFTQFGDGERLWFRRKINGDTFKHSGHTYDLNEFVRV